MATTRCARAAEPLLLMAAPLGACHENVLPDLGPVDARAPADLLLEIGTADLPQQEICGFAFKECADGPLVCIPRDWCCTNTDCPAQGQTCMPNGGCECPKGQRRCAEQCIGPQQCCVAADCQSQVCADLGCRPPSCSDGV
jgi:hypothetical protein